MLRVRNVRIVSQLCNDILLIVEFITTRYLTSGLKILSGNKNDGEFMFVLWINDGSCDTELDVILNY